MKKNVLLALFLAFAGIAFAQQNSGHKRLPVNIVAVGNSITDGYGSSSRETSWPGYLSKLLGRSHSVLNCGVSGTTMSRDADNSYWNTGSYTTAKNAKPEILIIALGTNDADPWRWRVTGKDFERDYRAMIQEFRNAGANPSLYFCLPPPKFPHDSEQNQVIENELMPKIRSLAAEYHAQLIDFHELMYNRVDVFPDDIHPDDAGALVMAQYVKRVLDGTQTLNFSFNISNGRVEDDRVAVVAQGGSVTVTPSANSGSWLWEGPNGFRSTNRSLSLNNVTSGGIYTLRHTTDQGFMEFDKVLVTVDGQWATNITPAVKVDGEGWQNNQSNLNVRPGVGYSFGPLNIPDVSWTWTGPNDFFAFTREVYIPVAGPVTAGTYTATITDAQGRQNSVDIHVTVSGERVCPNLVPYVNYDGWKQTTEVSVKAGRLVVFGPQPMTGNWSWKGPNGYTANGRTASVRDFDASKAGIYTATYTNVAGCEEQFEVNLKLDGLSITPYIYHEGEWKMVSDLVVRPGTEITFGPHPMDGNWTWERPNGGTANGRELTVTIDQNTAGTYTATYRGGDGTVLQKKFNIRLEDCPNITPYVQYEDEWKQVSDLTVRAGSEITFGPQPLDGDWTWERPDGSRANGRELTAIIDQNTAGNYIATYSNADGCVVEQVFDIRLLNCPDITPYIQYEDDWKQVPDLTVESGSEITFGPHPLDGNWTWERPDGSQATGRELTVTIDKNSAGTYTATYRNDEGCIVEQDFSIQVSTASGIDAAKAAVADDNWTDLQGRRVNPKNLSDGIYLHKDKKVLK